MEEKKYHGKVRTCVLIVMTAFLLAVFSLSGALCVYKYFNEQNTENTYQKLQKEVTITNAESISSTEISSSIPFKVDLASLQKKNSDTAGWLCVPCLEVSYPLMYSGDNDYYLHRDFKREYAYAGSLFLDQNNNPDFTDANTIIYGHNMVNGTMFGHLWHIPLQDAATTDPYFWIFTADGIYKYKIFSAYETDIYSEGFKQFRSGTQEFLSWCCQMRAQSYINTGDQSFDIGDKVVTLSTCASSSYYRTLVQGVRVESFPLETTDHPPFFSRPAKEVTTTEDLQTYPVPLNDKIFILYLGGFVAGAILLVVIITAVKGKTKRSRYEM